MFFRPKGHFSLKTDIHSHLVPGVDDGVSSVEEAISLIKQYQLLGYQRLVTTPHISESYYPNSPAKLKESYQKLVAELNPLDLGVKVDLAAEYMVDGVLLNTLKKNEELLSFDGHILIETSFRAIPWILDEVIFEIQSKNLIPILAHPERYPYFFEDQLKMENLRMRGVKMQVTIGSLVGQYGPEVKKMSRNLLKMGWVDFLGSDVHHMEHMKALKKGLGHRVLNGYAEEQFSNHKLK